MVMIDMDMPESCDDCPMAVCYEHGWTGEQQPRCNLTEKDIDIEIYTTSRPDWCELIDVGEGACEISQEGGEP